jgi:hypothetical protein
LPPKSKRERVSHIKENRRNERENMKSSSIKLEEENEIAETHGSDDEMSPILRMIKQKLEERQKK